MEELNKIVFKANEIIQDGGVILYPTDTVWGLGCDANNEEAIKKIQKIKKRNEEKSMICLVNGDRMLQQVFRNIPDVSFEILECAERPTTLVLDNPKLVSKQLIAHDGSLGVRVIDTPFCFRLIERMKRPLVSTSANFSGMPAPKTFKDIPQELIKQVDYVVPLDLEKQCKKASSIIKLTNDCKVTIIRK